MVATNIYRVFVCITQVLLLSLMQSSYAYSKLVTAQGSRSLVTCPQTGFTYHSHDDVCLLNFGCSAGTVPFKVLGCGCGCRVKAVPAKPANATSANSTAPVNTTTSVTCPTGPDFGYVTRTTPCVFNFLCAIDKQPFSIPGCGCGCRTVNATQPVVVNTTKPTTPSNITCPSGPDYSYTRPYPCVINFLCLLGTEAFSKPGCGCGCRKVNTTQPVVNVTTTINATKPVNTTLPSNVTCPKSPDYGYVTHMTPCFINFLCVLGKAPFSIPGCGCGCHTVNVTNPAVNTTIPVNTTKPSCPASSDYGYVTRQTPCVINFLCVVGKVPFSIPGCGCGCRTSDPGVDLNGTVPTNSTSPNSTAGCH